MTPNQKITIDLLLPEELIEDGVDSMLLNEASFCGFAEAIMFFFPHIAPVHDDLQIYKGFAVDSNKPVEGFKVVSSEGFFSSPPYVTDLPPYVLIPDESTETGFKYFLMLNELTNYKSDACMDLFDTFFDFTRNPLNISGLLLYLEDGRTIVRFNFEFRHQEKFIKQLKKQDIYKYATNIDVIDTLLDKGTWVYMF